MSDLDSNEPLNMIKIPGTHHSSIYNIEYTTNSQSFIFLFLQLFSFLPSVRNIIKTITITQQVDIYSQLGQGVRYLDIRLVNHNGNIHTAHTFIGPPLDTIFDQIVQFSNEFPREPIVIDISKDYENRYSFDEESLIKVNNLIREKLGNKYYFFKEKIPTVLDLSIRPILLAGDSEFFEHIPGIGPTLIIDYDWIDTSDLDERYAHNFKHLNKPFDPFKFNLIDIALSPQTKDVIFLAILHFCIVAMVIRTIFLIIFYETKDNVNVIILVLVSVLIFIGFCIAPSLKHLAESTNTHFLTFPTVDWNRLNITRTDFPSQEWINYIISLNQA